MKAKAIIVAVVLCAVVTSSSLTVPRAAPPEIEAPSGTQLGYARNVYKMLGGPWGEAKIYLDRWPEYAEYITGEIVIGG